MILVRPPNRRGPASRKAGFSVEEAGVAGRRVGSLPLRRGGSGSFTTEEENFNFADFGLASGESQRVDRDRV